MQELAALKAQAGATGSSISLGSAARRRGALEPALVAEVRCCRSQAHGAITAFETPVLAGRAGERGLVIETGGPRLCASPPNMVVNAAGPTRRRSRARSPACPDVEWADAIDYAVDPRRTPSSYAAIRIHWPDLPEGALQASYAGIRPKIARPGGSTTDFLLQMASQG
jgi:hypothetical protein